MAARAFGQLGVEITQHQTASPSDAMVDEVLAALTQYRAVVLRHQTGGDGDLVRFLARLGELTFTDGETPVEGAHDLNIVSNMGRERPPRSVFHTDTSYVTRPPAIGALRAVKLPIMGGSTVFTDQVHAAVKLPPKIRECLMGRALLHATTARDGTILSARHPVLRRHPISGDVALYLTTPERCSALSGCDTATSERIVDMLYRHSIHTSVFYRHEWQAGDVVLWDNRTTMHRAEHSEVVGDRVLHRGLVLGEVPIPA